MTTRYLLRFCSLGWVQVSGFSAALTWSHLCPHASYQEAQLRLENQDGFTAMSSTVAGTAGTAGTWSGSLSFHEVTPPGVAKGASFIGVQRATQVCNRAPHLEEPLLGLVLCGHCLEALNDF